MNLTRKCGFCIHKQNATRPPRLQRAEPIVPKLVLGGPLPVTPRLVERAAAHSGDVCPRRARTGSFAIVLEGRAPQHPTVLVPHLCGAGRVGLGPAATFVALSPRPCSEGRWASVKADCPGGGRVEWVTRVLDGGVRVLEGATRRGGAGSRASRPRGHPSCPVGHLNYPNPAARQQTG